MTVVHAKQLDPTVKLALGLQPLPARVWQVEEGTREGEARLFSPILALDLGTRTGWALRWDQDHVASGVEDFSLHRRREGLGPRVVRFRTWLKGILRLAQPTLVVYEQPVVASAWHHRSVAHNLEGVLLAEIEGKRDHVAPLSAQVRKHATGRGNPTRAELIAAVQARWNRAVRDPDEADALCLLAWALDLGGEVRA